jgi:hypothetical protein
MADGRAGEHQWDDATATLVPKTTKGVALKYHDAVARNDRFPAEQLAEL